MNLSAFDSNDVLSRVVYPDDNTDSPGSDDGEDYEYNRRGEVTRLTDQNGTQHVYSYDDLGRLRKDAATVASGSHIDDTVYLLEYNFDDFGNLINEASFDAGIKAINEIEREYDARQRVTRMYQNMLGSVNVTPTTRGPAPRTSLARERCTTRAPERSTWSPRSRMAPTTGSTTRSGACRGCPGSRSTRARLTSGSADRSSAPAARTRSTISPPADSPSPRRS